MIDTDICILLRNGRSKRVVERFDRIQRGEAVVSIVSYGELLFGAEKGPARARDLGLLEALLARLPVASLPSDAAGEYAMIRAGLERSGTPIGANDLWIAAHARAAGLTLVTNNEREFRRVPGLAVENWASEAA
jgi:tRNA(fMet)-specific endonuclease VapC